MVGLTLDRQNPNACARPLEGPSSTHAHHDPAQHHGSLLPVRSRHRPPQLKALQQRKREMRVAGLVGTGAGGVDLLRLGVYMLYNSYYECSNFESKSQLLPLHLVLQLRVPLPRLPWRWSKTKGGVEVGVGSVASRCASSYKTLNPKP